MASPLKPLSEVHCSNSGSSFRWHLVLLDTQKIRFRGERVYWKLCTESGAWWLLRCQYASSQMVGHCLKAPPYTPFWWNWERWLRISSILCLLIKILMTKGKHLKAGWLFEPYLEFGLQQRPHEQSVQTRRSCSGCSTNQNKFVSGWLDGSKTGLQAGVGKERRNVLMWG